MVLLKLATSIEQEQLWLTSYTHNSNTINAIYLSDPFEEKFSLSSLSFTLGSNQCVCSPDTHTTHSYLLNIVLPYQYNYFTAQEAFHDVKGTVNIQEIHYCEENQSISPTVTGVKNYRKLDT
jgi:hypothetical protein